MNALPRSPSLFGWLDRLLGLALSAALLMLAITAWPGAAQAADRVVGNGEAATEQRSPGDFDSIQTHGFKVSVQQGSTPSVSISADSNLLPLLETVVEGRHLVLRWKRGVSLQTRVPPTVQVTAVQLRALSVQGSGDILADGLKVAQLRVQVSGSGDVRLSALTADELAVDVAGSGNVVAAGQASALRVKIAGSGDVKAAGLRADEVRVAIAGSGDADVQAQRTLDISIAGSGDVRHTGNATVNTKVAGSGSVKKY